MKKQIFLTTLISLLLNANILLAYVPEPKPQKKKNNTPLLQTNGIADKPSLQSLIKKISSKINYKSLEKKFIENPEKLSHQIIPYDLNDDGKQCGVIAVTLLDASENEVWSVLNDWRAFGPHMPNLDYYKTIKVVQKADRFKNKKSLIEGKISPAFFTMHYTLEVEFDKKNKALNWHMLNEKEINKYNKKFGKNLVREECSFLEAIEGSGSLKPYTFKIGDRTVTKTLYYYSPVVEVSTIPMPYFIKKKLTVSGTEEFLEALKKLVSIKKEKSKKKNI